MRIRGRGGAITPAEGCMFFAVILFVVLLLGLLYIAFMRFGNPPPPSEAAPVTWSPPAAVFTPPGLASRPGADGSGIAPDWRAVYGWSAVTGGIRGV